jgi:DNA-binding LacI/PurR family transcriptional regulator
MVNQRVTINQVAQEAGVSKQTVSRVINNRDDVAPETRCRVLEVVERLGYRPSAVARSLSHQRGFALGVVISGLKYVGPSRTLNGITLEAEKMGYSVILKELPDFHSNEGIEPLLDSLLSQQVEGLIWAVPEIGQNRAWFDARGADLSVPILFLTAEPRTGTRSIAFDNELGGELACEHLIKQGCTNIGHISGP